MVCTNLMKALRMWIYGASVAAKLSIHGFRSPLILIEVIDHDGSEELLNPSGRKQLHMTTFTTPIKSCQTFLQHPGCQNSCFFLLVKLHHSQMMLLKNFWLMSIKVLSDMMTREFIRSSLLHCKFSFTIVKKKIKWRGKSIGPLGVKFPKKKLESRKI